MSSQRIVPVIMCGGSGTRLWPVSRESMPKQFAPLIGTETTFQQALRRVSDRTLFDRPIVITHSDFRFVVAEQLRDCGIAAEIVLEPMRRDSGAAVAVAAVLAGMRVQHAITLVLAADHVIRDQSAFLETCREAVSPAADGHIVTFGVPPNHPATNYGYIRSGASLSGGSACAVDTFVEKPDALVAARYVAENYLWNSGNFMFRADVMLSELAELEPAIIEAAQAAVAGAERDLDFLRLHAESFGRAPKKAIDYAVMEQTRRAAVIPADFGWSDIGSWSAIWEELDHDASGNALEGPAIAVECRNTLVKAEDGVVTAVLGLDDIAVVTTSDAVLVARRNDSDKVKSVVELLKRQNHRQATEHNRSYRPWGYYQKIDAGARYQVKRIVVTPGASLSLQKHLHRAEHWIVVKGTAEATVGSELHVVHENESVYIPIGSTHRLANPGRIPLELIEVQVGSYLGEDDIIRLDDAYGRN